LQFYNTLLSKMNESSMATALERRQQGEQFRVMDAPNLPEEPTFPNRLAFAGGGFAAGLTWPLLIAGLLEYRDTSLRNERDIWAFTKLPTLAIISHIDELPQPAPEHSSRWKLFSRGNKTIGKRERISHVQILLRPSGPSFRSQPRSAVSVYDAADSGGACLPAIRHCERAKALSS
jgi:hypothetical protein